MNERRLRAESTEGNVPAWSRVATGAVRSVAAILGIVSFTLSAASQDPPQLVSPLENLRTAISNLDDSAIIGGIIKLKDAPDNANAIPLLFDALNHPVDRHQGSGNLCRILIPNVVDGMTSIGLAPCLKLADAGKWVEWGEWSSSAALSCDPAELALLLRHPQEEVVLRAAFDFARLAPEAAHNGAEHMLSAAGIAEKISGAISCARIDRDDRGLTTLLAQQLESKDADPRFWTIWSLGERLPRASDFVLEALTHEDVRVREEAIAPLESGVDPRRFVSPLPDLLVGGYGGYSRAPSGEWREAQLFTTLTSEHPQQLIAGALRDSSELVRQTAAMLVAKIGVTTIEGRSALLESCLSKNAETSFWAKVALARADNLRWPSFRRLVESNANGRAGTSAQHYSPEEARAAMDRFVGFETLTDAHGYYALPSKSDDLCFDVIRELAREEGAKLLEDGAHDVAQAVKNLDRAELIIRYHIRALIAAATENTFEADDACKVLVDIGPAAVDQIAAAWLVVSEGFYGGHGEVVMDELGQTLSKMGKDAIPALCFGLERRHFQTRCGDYLSCQNLDAALAAPAWLWAWCTPQGSDDFLGIEWGWDSKPARIRSVVLRGGAESNEEQDWTGIACARMGEASLPILMRAIASPIPVMRERACHGLRWIGKLDAASIDVLRTAIADKHPRVRIAAAQALVDCAKADRDLRRQAHLLLADARRE